MSCSWGDNLLFRYDGEQAIRGLEAGWKEAWDNIYWRYYLWLLPFSKDSSSSSLFSRSLLFMKGNLRLKLIFCFALGPRFRVPVDLGRKCLNSCDFKNISISKIAASLFSTLVWSWMMNQWLWGKRASRHHTARLLRSLFGRFTLEGRHTKTEEHTCFNTKKM